jgi:excisionase family DNA binding protein
MMAPDPPRPPVDRLEGDLSKRAPRFALTREEAARSLGMSLDSFERYVQAEVRLVRRGRLRLVPVRDLEAWVERNAERPLVEAGS